MRRVPKYRNREFRGWLCAGLIIVTAAQVAVSGQTRNSRSIPEQLESIETAVRALSQQVGELTSTLKLALPPSPIEDLVPFQIPLGDGAVKGSEAAKLVLIEYSDFQCPYCGRSFQTVLPELQRELVDTGLIKYQFRNLPVEASHPIAFKAAQAAECARVQGKFWEMHDRLFGDQQALNEARLFENAQALSLDLSAFRSCFAGDQASTRIKADLDDARRFGITGTPTFLLGRLQSEDTVRIVKRIVGSQPVQVFKTAVQTMVR